jgi:ribonuclease P protein component
MQDKRVRLPSFISHLSSFIFSSTLCPLSLMKRSFSLRRGVEFQRVWDEGKSFSHPRVIARVRANGLEARRFGFVAGKKIGKATARNRAKRWLRESVRRRLPSLVPGWDVILIARGNALRGTFQEMDAAVEQVLRRAQLLRAS